MKNPRKVSVIGVGMTKFYKPGEKVNMKIRALYPDETPATDTDVKMKVYRHWWDREGNQYKDHRKDIFEDPKMKDAYQKKFNAALAPPKTWEEYAQIAQFITDQMAPNVYGAAHFRKAGSPCNQFAFLQQFRANGQDVHDRSGNAEDDQEADDEEQPPHSGDVLASAELGYEFVDWGGAHHAGGGSHGSLHRDDSEGVLLLCGLDAPEREQWSLTDVTRMVLNIALGRRAGDVG